MNFFKYLFFLSFLTYTLPNLANRKYSAEEYIDIYKKIAVKEMKRSGIPASITLAQGMLESDNGNSSLAIKANNHFGIKCHKDWNGGTYYQDDDTKDECFRKYKNAEESFDDHTNFLINGQRYQFLFDYKSNDYKQWAHGLKKAGYATNRQYPELLINLIERYQLYKFDEGDITFKPEIKEKKKKEPAENFTIQISKRKIYKNNNIDYVLAEEGETLTDIANEFDMMRWQLPWYNDIDKDTKLSPGQMVYLQPKRRKAEEGKEFHTVEEGQSMLYLSQKYGVKLRRMYRMNRMEKGSQPEIGQKMWLRSRKPKE